jgi:NAD(P)-dependent dehydrogenase (short-subunit alcohol dehydrogenase family)
MPGRFEGRVAVVTGAASGIGLGIAERFAEEGAWVALLDQHETDGETAATKIGNSGGICEFFRVDVSSEPDVVQALQRVTRRFGGVHHLVNNAGIVLVKGVEDCTVEEWDRVMNVNLKSVFLMVKHSLLWLRQSAGATVVNIGSVSSLIAQQGTPAYVASKGAVLLLSKALALDLAPIRVNCVCPGITDTPMLRSHVNATPDPEKTLQERLARVPLRRALLPRDIAETVLYLSSDQSSGVTGTSVVVDGGYTAAAEWSSNT